MPRGRQRVIDNPSGMLDGVPIGKEELGSGDTQMGVSDKGCRQGLQGIWAQADVRIDGYQEFAAAGGKAQVVASAKAQIRRAAQQANRRERCSHHLRRAIA
jgi:hypothetical protein